MQLLTALRDARHPYGPRQDRLFRMHPERWLESLVRADVCVIDERLETESAYSHVPAFSAADRAMIDVFTLTKDARLAVVELKADEHIHLPLQGLDYWSRVAWHHARGEFLKFGYFGGGPGRGFALVVPGGAGVACASRNRCDPSLHFAGDRVGVCWD